ncbi:MAG TPA: hypothetical protein EYH45_07990 [Candidatus Caldiarchaeum subterraneum]|uniref:Cobalamin-independent methionine synthase MetE C-terminal/archaeal domain-containing protein n=1 Tax=Caldiarchaeum subterraneum TaxID=311458 RepID=A0A833A5P7_CALS0|nr:hypothetical protein [Candidatus Caldarchaeum subterraneum]
MRKEKVLESMEVGSLSKAPFISKNKEKAVRLAEEWGRRLDVENWEKLVKDLKENKVNEEQLTDWACIYALRFFENAGLDIIYDGEQRRKEMYEYPVYFIDGFEFKGVVKVWDYEYYRKAAVVSKPRLKKPYHVEEFLFAKKHAKKPLKIPITGAYTLADWSFDEHYIKKREDTYGENPRQAMRDSKLEFAIDLAKEVIRPNVKALAEAGATHIQIDEPAAAAKPDEADIFVESFNESIKGINCEVTVHICYTNYAWLFPHLLEIKADNLSISCSNADTKELGIDDKSRRGFKILQVFQQHNVPFRIAPGVIDVHTEYIEPPELVRDRLLYAVRIMGNDPYRIITCNDCGLRTRSWEVAYQKEVNMVRGAELARRVLT